MKQLKLEHMMHQGCLLRPGRPHGPGMRSDVPEFLPSIMAGILRVTASLRMQNRRLVCNKNANLQAQLGHDSVECNSIRIPLIHVHEWQ